MPLRALRPCSAQPCPNLVPSGRCAKHAVSANAARNARVETMAARGYDPEWRRFKRAVLKERAFCVACGAPATDLDHIRELKDGGARLDPANVQPLCHAHHVQKTNAVRRARA